MSILVPDLKVFEAVYDKAVSYQYHNVCDESYCSSLSALGDEESAKQWVKNILYLNEWGFNVRYEDGETPELYKFLKFNWHERSISAVQMLKYLQCIAYNIEIDTIKFGMHEEDNRTIPTDLLDSYSILLRGIEEISNAIISNLIPEYKTANWSEI